MPGRQDTVSVRTTLPGRVKSRRQVGARTPNSGFEMPDDGVCGATALLASTVER